MLRGHFSSRRGSGLFQPFFSTFDVGYCTSTTWVTGNQVFPKSSTFKFHSFHFIIKASFILLCTTNVINCIWLTNGNAQDWTSHIFQFKKKSATLPHFFKKSSDESSKFGRAAKRAVDDEDDRYRARPSDTTFQRWLTAALPGWISPGCSGRRNVRDPPEWPKIDTNKKKLWLIFGSFDLIAGQLCNQPIFNCSNNFFFWYKNRNLIERNQRRGKSRCDARGWME